MNELESARYLAQTEYGLVPLIDLRPLPAGRVNLTFLVSTKNQKFILQRLHPIFGSDGGVVDNLEAISHSLIAAGLVSPLVLKTVSGESWVLYQDRIWRLLSWLPGSTVSRRKPGPVARASGYLGLFHRALLESPPILKPPPPLFRQEGPIPAARWRELDDKFRGHPKHGRALPLLKRGLALTRGLPGFEIPTRAFVHGDPKLENFLFADDGRVTGLIDLDTVHHGALIWDLADGLRSWAGLRHNNGQVSLDREIFLAATESYGRSGLVMTSGEWAIIPQAVQAVALKLAWRYLTDYFEESYFAWDRANYPSLAEQNIGRGQGMLSLAEDIERQRDELRTKLRRNSQGGISF